MPNLHVVVLVCAYWIATIASAGVAECWRERNWVDEGPYEVQGVSVGETVLTTEAPRKGRENTAQKVQQVISMTT